LAHRIKLKFFIKIIWFLFVSVLKINSCSTINPPKLQPKKSNIGQTKKKPDLWWGKPLMGTYIHAYIHTITHSVYIVRYSNCSACW
jgi:hypothetical protein